MKVILIKVSGAIKEVPILEKLQKMMTVKQVVKHQMKDKNNKIEKNRGDKS